MPYGCEKRASSAGPSVLPAITGVLPAYVLTVPLGSTFQTKQTEAQLPLGAILRMRRLLASATKILFLLRAGQHTRQLTSTQCAETCRRQAPAETRSARPVLHRQST